MSDPDRKDFNPNATIQLSLDEVQLAELEARLDQPPLDPRNAAAPPPLPSTAPAGPLGAGPDDRGPAAARRHSVGKKIAYSAMVLALLAVAVAAGILVGGAPAAAPQADPSASDIARPPEARHAATPPPSASSTVLTMPTIEMR